MVITYKMNLFQRYLLEVYANVYSVYVCITMLCVLICTKHSMLYATPNFQFITKVKCFL